MLVAALFVYPCKYATGQVSMADTTRLEKQLSILNKKVFLHFPAASVASPRVADIMVTDPNENKETRIIYDNGKMRLVFLAQELFSLAGNTLFADMQKQVEPDFDFQRKILTDSASLFSILSTPTLFDSTRSAILVNSLMIQSPDNTVSRIDAYINPDSWNTKEEYIKLTENIFKTLQKGTRAIPLNARTETYKIPGAIGQFSFNLPENYFVTLDEKYDFSIFKINKFKKLTDDSYTSITIYTGHHPTYFYKEYALSDSAAVKPKGMFLQKNRDWLFFSDMKNNFFLMEQIISADELEAGLVFHVALLTNKKEIMEELKLITEKIKLVK